MKASLGGSIWKEFRKRDKQRRKVGGTRKQDVVSRLNQLQGLAENIIENEDKKGVNRKGKDVAHVKALSKGGTNADGYRLEAPSKNRSFRRNSDGSMK